MNLLYVVICYPMSSLFVYKWTLKELIGSYWIFRQGFSLLCISRAVILFICLSNRYWKVGNILIILLILLLRIFDNYWEVLAFRVFGSRLILRCGFEYKRGMIEHRINLRIYVYLTSSQLCLYTTSTWHASSWIYNKS